MVRPVPIAMAVSLLLVSSGHAQQSGWTYSPYDGEGDRAAMGCAYGSTPEAHACVVIRCEDDLTVAVHIDTTRPDGDAGRWSIGIDDETFDVTATAIGASPYGAKLAGDVAPLIGAIRNGSALYLDPRDGAAVPRNGIGLAGSLRAINEALFYCAPRTPTPPSADNGAKQGTDNGSDD